MAYGLAGTTLISDANLVDLWQLESVTSYNGTHNLTNNGSVTFTSAKFNNGANFTSSNSTEYLSLASNLGITGGACTIGGWFKLLALPGSGVTYTLASQSDATNDNYYQIRVVNTAGVYSLQFVRGKNGIAETAATYNFSPDTTTFHQIVLTYDTTNINGYFDNTLVAGPTAASGAGGASPGNNFDLGASGSPANYSSAILDDWAVFTRAISSTDVTTWWKSPVPQGGAVLLNNFL